MTVIPSTVTPTELDALNKVLGAVGQAPITTINLTNPDAAIAWATLQDCNREVQAEGWNFNRQRQYPLIASGIGILAIPSEFLYVSLSDTAANRGIDVTVRQAKLYNLVDHTFTWTPNETYLLDIVEQLSFEDLPIPAREYIIARAAVQSSYKIVGDQALYQMLQQKEAFSRSSLMTYETEQGNYSIFGWRLGENLYDPYRPFKALTR
jgi:hypothetical protein